MVSWIEIGGVYAVHAVEERSRSALALQRTLHIFGPRQDVLYRVLELNAESIDIFKKNPPNFDFFCDAFLPLGSKGPFKDFLPYRT